MLGRRPQDLRAGVREVQLQEQRELQRLRMIEEQDAIRREQYETEWNRRKAWQDFQLRRATIIPQNQHNLDDDRALYTFRTETRSRLPNEIIDYGIGQFLNRAEPLYLRHLEPPTNPPVNPPVNRPVRYTPQEGRLGASHYINPQQGGW
ncbi:MAG: hypothetical protein ACO3UU_07045 [Minisyncoccia bacterium]